MFWTRFMSLCTERNEAPNVVAAKCGVKSTGTVTGWKKGAMPRESILNRLADYFGVSVEYLTGTESIKKESTSISESELQDSDIDLLEAFKRAEPDIQELIRRTLKLK